MEPTIPEQVINENPNPTPEEGAPAKSNVQARIDELTAEKHAARQAAEEAQRQAQQAMATVAELLKQQTERAKPAEPKFEVPEGVDPALAKFLLSQNEKMVKEAELRAQNLFWQLQNQMDQQSVSSKYGHLPSEVVADAANRYTGLKQRYGGAATMDDAVALAHFEWVKKQGMNAQRQQYNAMGAPLANQRGQIEVSGYTPQSTQLAPPSSRPDWDNLDYHTQNKLIDEWERKGGKISL